MAINTAEERDLKWGYWPSLKVIRPKGGKDIAPQSHTIMYDGEHELSPPHPTRLTSVKFRDFSWAISSLVINKSHLNLAILWHSFWLYWRIYVKVCFYWNIATYSVESGTWFSNFCKAHCNKNAAIHVQFYGVFTKFSTQLVSQQNCEARCKKNCLV